MKTQKPKPRTTFPNSRRLTAAGAMLIAALLLFAPTSTFAQSQNAEQPAGQAQQPAAGGFSQSADSAAAGGFGQAAPSGQFRRFGLGAEGAVQPFEGGFSQPADGAGPGAFNQAAPSGQLQGPVRQPQQSAPLPKVPDNLEEMLSVALRSNPEILLAESKLRQAQSELNQARLKVTEEVVSLYYERKKQEELLGQLSQQLKAVQSAFQAGQTPSEKVIEAMIARSTAAAAVPQIEAQTRYLLGLGGDNPARYLLGLGGGAPTAQAMPQAGARSEAVTTLPRPEMPEEFRNILDVPATFEFEDTTLELVFEYLKSEYKVQIYMDAAVRDAFGADAPIDFTVQGVTLGQALQAMLDSGFSDPQGNYELCFVVREYGILVSTPERARKLYGATIPPELPMDASAVPPAERQ